MGGWRRLTDSQLAELRSYLGYCPKLFEPKKDDDEET